jgi:hypothetical protein
VGARLKKMRRAEGGAKIFGVFRVKNHDFTPKNLIFSNFRGVRPPPWIHPWVLLQTPKMGVFIPVHSICSILNPVLCNILPAAHAITGCDSTTSLFGIDKRTVFKVLKDSPENFRDLSILADCDTDKSIDATRKLVCRLYDQKGKQ